MSERKRWLEWLDRIAGPVLSAMAEGRLAPSLPRVCGQEDRGAVASAEAFCRTFTGIAPWLERIDEGDELERALRTRYRKQTVSALREGVSENSADRFPFEIQGQPLVEAAFLCHGLLRCPSIWDALDKPHQRALIDRLVCSRATTPGFNNWLLFSAMVEAFFASVGEFYDAMRIDYALRQHEQWYCGDGVYGDGPHFHADYYNSFVIQPMLIDILEVLGRVSGEAHPLMEQVAKRFVRYAAIQERQISPEGTYPPVGRSLAYRFGVFQHLAQAALQDRLPPEVRPAQVRDALTSVLARSLSAEETFTRNGWLNVGVAGHQPGLGEPYISRGSLYLCTTVFLPLGLPASDPFWSDPPADWTAKRVWNGSDLPTDHSLRE